MSEYERQYEDGSDPQVLDVIDVPVLEPQPKDYQTENWQLDPEHYWERADQLTVAHLPALTDPIAPLWVDGYHTRIGRNDKIPIAEVGTVAASLRLLHVDRLQLVVCTPGEAFGNNKRRVQGQFQHARKLYALWVTDPGSNGTYAIGECYLTISLGEPYQDACYKLIAAIIPAA